MHQHRGACAADNVSGDGSGVMTEIPWNIIRDDCPAVEKLLEEKAEKAGVKTRLRAAKALMGVGMMMLDQDEKVRGEIKALVDEAAEASGFKVVAWRPVPVDLSILGEASAETVPHIEQLIVAPLKEYEAEYEEDAPEASDPENPHKFWADKIQAEKDLDDLVSCVPLVLGRSLCRTTHQKPT